MVRKTDNNRGQVLEAVHACEDKKAEDIAILELDKDSGAFTDFFVICSGSNPRQVQAISDEVEQRLSRSGERPANVEGYKQAEWVLLDYVNFVVHVFSPKARNFYNLERLWKSAKRFQPSEFTISSAKKAAVVRSSGPKAKTARASTPRSAKARTGKR
ncbi:MAG TPA: ribosome silencing factor [Terriglobales bacterium]|nr:ribosome silencing factor [Terriglobales bacterium]